MRWAITILILCLSASAFAEKVKTKKSKTTEAEIVAACEAIRQKLNANDFAQAMGWGLLTDGQKLLVEPCRKLWRDQAAACNRSPRCRCRTRCGKIESDDIRQSCYAQCEGIAN